MEQKSLQAEIHPQYVELENQTEKTKKVWREKPVINSSSLQSVGPPKTCYATPDFYVTANTSDYFTVPNSITDPNRGAGRLVENTLYLCPRVRGFEDIHLTDGGEKIKFEPNAGGNSVTSEVLSFEILRCMHGAKLKRTEMELEYFPYGGKITDYSIMCYDLHIGVSVTRAMKYKGRFGIEDGKKLLKKKLYGVLESSRLVVEAFHKQILHIFAREPYIADVLREVYYDLDAELKGNTVVIVTVPVGADWIFTNWQRNHTLV